MRRMQYSLFLDAHSSVLVLITSTSLFFVVFFFFPVCWFRFEGSLAQNSSPNQKKIILEAGGAFAEPYRHFSLTAVNKQTNPETLLPVFIFSWTILGLHCPAEHHNL